MADVIRPYVGEKVLEIGAGTGNLTLQLTARKLYWASDINPLYLSYLENVGRNRPYLRVSYTDGQLGHSYPKEQKFDTVICLNVIEHLADDLGALRNIREVLEDNGRAIVLVPCVPCLLGTLADFLAHHHPYTPIHLNDLPTTAAFRLETILEVNQFGVI